MLVMQNPTMYNDIESNVGANSAEDERTLQIALELSNLGLLGNCDDDAYYDEAARGKKSQNMTECVPVPSSEHVAEIVGRQGCKIKALRAKTNTYIKTPVRGEEPVFVVTGRKEDVAMARREVQSAAEHFTQIRASRNRHALLASQAFGSLNADGTAGTITLQVRVPYRVVGLVVGPKGATIKRIQQQTHTYIVTPSREKEPVFEVTGLPENVEKAKEEIEAHIALRTCAQQTSIDDDFKNNGTEVGSPCNNADLVKSTFNPQSVAASTVSNSILRSAAPNFFPMSAQTLSPPHIPSQPAMIVPSSFDVLGYTERSYNGSTVAGGFTQDSQKLNGSWNMPVNGQYDIATTLPSFLSTLSNASLSNSSINSGSSQHRLSPTLSEPEFSNFAPLLMSTGNSGHLPIRRVESEDSSISSAPSVDVVNMLSPTNYTSTPAVNIESGYSSSGTADSMSGSPDAGNLLRDNLQTKVHQRCVVCCDNQVSAALVPCGHHLFCFTCAKDIVGKSPALCPCCHQNAVRPLLIKQ